MPSSHGSLDSPKYMCQPCVAQAEMDVMTPSTTRLQRRKKRSNVLSSSSSSGPSGSCGGLMGSTALSKPGTGSAMSVKVGKSSSAAQSELAGVSGWNESRREAANQRRPASMRRGKMNMRKTPRMRALPDMRMPFSVVPKSNFDVAYIWMRMGAYPVANWSRSRSVWA